jgi:hypothetical protein
MSRKHQQHQLRFQRCALWLVLISSFFQYVQSRLLSSPSSLPSLSSVPVDMPSPLTDTEFVAPTVTPVSSPPNPGYPACILCGEGRSIRFPERTVSFPSQPEISCQALQDAAMDGYVPAAICPEMPKLIGDACACDDDDPPSVAPVGSQSPTRTMSNVGRQRLQLIVGLVIILTSLVEIAL